jgi:glyoxylase-like metal-dependent hydrolase (beta-lactamase superfamily II)
MRVHLRYDTLRARARRHSLSVVLCLPALLAVQALTAQAPAAQTPASLVRRAVDAIGGEQAVRGVTSAVSEINSVSYQLGQEETPLSPPRLTISFNRVAYDFDGGRLAISSESRPFAGPPLRARRVVAGGAGMVVNNTNASPDSPAGVAAVERGMRTTPVQLLRTALESPGTLRPATAKRWRGEVMDGVRMAGRDTVVMYFDRGSGLLTVVETVTDDPILGDRRTATWYTRWQDADTVKMPRQIDTEVNGRVIQSQLVTAVSVNDALADSTFAMPDSIRSRASRGPATPAPIAVTLAEIAPGVWRAEGGSHFSLVVEQPDRLVVVEAPLNAQRSRAVLDTLRSRFPSKRVGLVVNTHHHWDHAGGVREYMASGVPVATHRRNVDFVRQIAAATKTVARDAISRGRAAPAVTAVGDSLALGSGASRVVLHRLPSTHAEGILAAYVPNARILFVADVLSPGANLPKIGSEEVAALVASRALGVDRVVGAHGGIAAWADVQRAAAR